MKRRKYTVLTAADVGRLLRLDVADAAVIVGSGVRVPAEWPDEYSNQLGCLDLTLTDCAILTGLPVSTVRGWRERGLLKVRAVSMSRSQSVLVTPAELVRVLKGIADQRNGTTELVETPTQEARRLDAEHAAALAACRGE